MQAKFKFSKIPYDTQMVSVRGTSYPVYISGTGKIPLFCYGLATLMRRTFSNTIHENFRVYTTDLYWEASHRLATPEKDLTMKRIVEDAQELITHLGLKEYILCGHSTYGIVAGEIAKHDPRVRGLVMIGSPPDWNDHTWKSARAYFDAHADESRKANDTARREHYELIKKPTDSEVCINAYIKDTPRYWYDYHIPDQTLIDLWEGVVADDPAINVFFSKVLPHHNHATNIEKVTCPTLLVGGPFDFDCIPLVLWKEAVKPKYFQILECPESGHWPHFEQPDVFDPAFLMWASQLPMEDTFI